MTENSVYALEAWDIILEESKVTLFDDEVGLVKANDEVRLVKAAA